MQVRAPIWGFVLLCMYGACDLCRGGRGQLAAADMCVPTSVLPLEPGARSAEVQMGGGRGRGGGAARDGFGIAFNGIGMPVLSRHAVPARSLVQCRACACEWHEGETGEERGSRLAKVAVEDAVFMAMRRWGAWCMVHGTGHCITVSASGNGTLAAVCLVSGESATLCADDACGGTVPLYHRPLYHSGKRHLGSSLCTVLSHGRVSLC